MKTGDYEILSKLGQGSFGTVYKVQSTSNSHIGSNEVQVMKIIDMSHMDRRHQQEAENEAKILQQLESPYIVKYIDSFIECSKLHIVMEYCDKGDLSDLIQRQGSRPLSESKIWKYFTQMCLGLEYLHSCKILHRDIKSMNIFLTKDDNIRIGDLGVAKILSQTGAFAHTMVGTPYYLSPELCEEKPYNNKSDVWALGCILYEMCTLKRPFDATNQGALILKILRGSYQPVSNQYTSTLREFIRLMLYKDYRKRPSVTQLLKHPVLVEKAGNLNVWVPAESVLSIEKALEKKAKIEEKKQEERKNEKRRTNFRIRKGAPTGLSRYAQRPRINGYSKLPKRQVSCDLIDEVLEVQNLPSLRNDPSNVNTLEFKVMSKPTSNLMFFEENKESETCCSEDFVDENTVEFHEIVQQASVEELTSKLREVELRESYLGQIYKNIKVEIAGLVGETLFNQLYDVYKEAVGESTIQNNIDQFFCENIPPEMIDVKYKMFRLMYIEAELEETMDAAKGLKFELL